MSIMVQNGCLANGYHNTKIATLQNYQLYSIEYFKLTGNTLLISLSVTATVPIGVRPTLDLALLRDSSNTPI